MQAYAYCKDFVEAEVEGHESEVPRLFKLAKLGGQVSVNLASWTACAESAYAVILTVKWICMSPSASFTDVSNVSFIVARSIELEIIRLFGGEVTRGDLLRLGILISY